MLGWYSEGHPLGGLMQQHASGAAPASPDEAHEHFDQAAAAVDSSMMRSAETPTFGKMTSQLFGAADSKADLLNALLAGAAPAVLAQIAALVGHSGTVTPEQAAALAPGLTQRWSQRLLMSGQNSFNAMPRASVAYWIPMLCPNNRPVRVRSE